MNVVGLPYVLNCIISDHFFFLLGWDQDLLIHMESSQFEVEVVDGGEVICEDADNSYVATDEHTYAVPEADDDPSEPIENQQEQDMPSKSTSKAKLRDFITGQDNKNTAKKTASCINRFSAWLLAEKNVAIDPVLLPPEELDTYLGEWISSLKKSDSSDYEPDSITSFHRGVARYLKDKGYGVNIVDDYCFDTSNRVLKAKRKQLKSAGLGNKPNKAEPISDEHLELWEKGLIGMHGARPLLNMLYLYLTEGFGLRASHESRQMTWGDVTLHKSTNADGVEEKCLKFRERLAKTRPDGTVVRRYVPAIHENKDNPNKCPIKAYELYKEQRPEHMMYPEAPVYLSVNYNKAHNSLWFKAQAFGENSMCKVIKKMFEEVGITDHHYTNHSIRKTGITKLLHEEISPTEIAQYSGHKNINSISNYACISEKQRKNISHILQGIKPSSTISAAPAIEAPNSGMLEIEAPSTSMLEIEAPPSTQQSIQSTSTTRRQFISAKRSHSESSQIALSSSQSTVTTNLPGSPPHSFSTKRSKSLSSAISGLFAGANITGGTFNVSIHPNAGKFDVPSTSVSVTQERNEVEDFQ